MLFSGWFSPALVQSAGLFNRGGSFSGRPLANHKSAIGFAALLLVFGCKDHNNVPDVTPDTITSSDIANPFVGQVEAPKRTTVVSNKEHQEPVDSVTGPLITDEAAILRQVEVSEPVRLKEANLAPIYSSPSEVIGLIRSFAPNGEILNIDVSADGKAVIFESDATNLVRGDTNQTTDVFLLLAEHRLLKRISVDSLGNQVVGNSGNPRISPDGGWVVYESYAKGLDPRDVDQFRDVYLHEIGTGSTTLVSVSIDGSAGNRNSGKPVVSHNANTIAFESEATNLVESDENKSSDVFVYSKLLESVRMVSKPILDKQIDANKGNQASYNPDLSDDGVYVTFESFSGGLALDDYNSNSDVFLHNLVSQTTALISKFGPSGALVSGDSTNPSVSGDGKTVVFESQAQFFKTDLNKVRDSYIYDVPQNKLTKLPAEALFADDSVGFVGSSHPIISGDGSVVVYEISVLANEKQDEKPSHGTHLAYYEIADNTSGRLSLFEVNNETINNILDYSVSLSSDAEVLAFHVSQMDDSLNGRIAPKSGWLSKKHE